ncbi:hypothetical protein ABT330_07220 [Streptomyces sp. NPDC000658]|uniref:hypothetical protein n=1 Tax=Streptomyces sp. NPDC000658 TaxID=3154266 RepID=UPI003316753D
MRASVRSGVTCTVAAGGAGRPAALHSPADVRGAVTVDAADRGDVRAACSALGLFAPGGSIASASRARDTGRTPRSAASTAAPHLAGPRRATPAQVAKALVAEAAHGKVSGRGPGSPDRLLQVPPFM